VTNAATSISNGLFAVTLDFGGVFDGSARWLEIAVRTNGGGAFVALSPRQPITATPYAVRAAEFGGAVGDGQLSTNIARLNATQVFTGSNGFATLVIADGSGAEGQGGRLHIGGFGANADSKLIFFGDEPYVYLGETGQDDTLEFHAPDDFISRTAAWASARSNRPRISKSPARSKRRRSWVETFKG